MPYTATHPMMRLSTEHGRGGTPPRPSPPTTTWSSSSGASSSRRDFTAHALTWPHLKKPEPSSQPGPQPEHDQPKLRNTRGPAGDRQLQHAVTTGGRAA